MGRFFEADQLVQADQGDIRTAAPLDDERLTTLRPTHKELLMEHLAAALWRASRRTWGHEHLENWLDDFLLENPRLEGAYRNAESFGPLPGSEL